MSGFKNFRKSSSSSSESWSGRRRFEHWYLDNQVYFITARCRDRFPAFNSEAAKAVFWDRFEHYAAEFRFTPWVTSLLDNHYHTLGYLRIGEKLGPMMQRLHGSIAKLVNDSFTQRRTPFWSERGIAIILTVAFVMRDSVAWRMATHSGRLCDTESCATGESIRTRGR
jgi:REP element-mobilizing transposase RayT